MDDTTDLLLLIESDLAHATKILDGLTGQGQPRVEWVKSLSEGLQRLEQPGIAAILLNPLLADSRGIETFERVLAAAEHTPILVLCGAGNERLGRLAVEHGADDFLPSDHYDSYSLTRAVRRMRERRFVEKERAEVSHLAYHDFLTDLPNRMLLNDRLEQAISLAERHGYRIAVLFLDLDRFKHINDSLGHAIGDQLLKAVAMRLKGCVRRSDTVGRQGGDEFVVVLSELEVPANAGNSAAQLLASLTAPYRIGHHELHVPVSIGVSIYPDDGEDAETLINNADTAMYHAKENGRHNYQFFRPEMIARAVERQFIEGGLRVALERSELSLHYQPKVDLGTGAIVGVEALLRWQHPERGFIPPSQFVPVAEDSGLILPIGQWVLREACRQSRAWLDAGLQPILMAVNISPAEFRSRGFVDGVRTTLKETRLEPQCLEIELTESALMKHAESTVSLLKALKSVGVRLTVDDFGTGYSSLSYLRQFPIDSLKVDRSFVHEISSKSDDSVIVSAVISMGSSLKKRVIAEGVETREQLDFLTAAGCEEAQGYYFNHPMASGQLAELLEARRPAGDAQSVR